MTEAYFAAVTSAIALAILFVASLTHCDVVETCATCPYMPSVFNYLVDPRGSESPALLYTVAMES